MNEINNLTYKIEINFINNSGINSSISVKFCDNGLKVKCVRVGNDSIVEETLNGRVLSGRIDNLDGFCGYRYDYQNGEYLLKINPNVSINDAVALINKTKRETSFLTAEMVMSSISRNDYRVVTLNEGRMNMTRTVSAENKKSQHCSLQEIVDLSKLYGDGSFAVQGKSVIYQMGDKCVLEENQTVAGAKIKLQLSELLEVLNQNPQNYKELINIKNQIQKRVSGGSEIEEKSF